MYTYDAVGRATTLQSSSNGSTWSNVASSGTYNAAGQLTGWLEPGAGGTQLTRSYDPARGWLTSLSAGSVLNLQYGYNADGQAISVTDAVNPGQGVTSYTYL